MIDKIERFIKHVYIIAILLIAAAFVGLIGYAIYKFESKSAVYHSEVHNHYYYDSTKKEIQIKEVPGPVRTILQEVPQKVDTAKILQDYYSLQIFKQTIQDSSFRATITDTLQQNRLKGRGFQYQIFRPTAVLQAPNPRNKIFVGMSAAANRTGFTSFGPAVTLVTKKDHLYSAGYNLIDNSVYAGIGWKIGIKK